MAGSEALGPSPPVEEFAWEANRRSDQFLWAAVLLAVPVGVLAATFDLASPLILLSAGAVLLVPVLLWYYPRTSLYLTFAAACLFELQPTPYADALTDRVPFFWNINTIFQRYANFDLKGVPLNLFEVLMLAGGAASVAHALVSRRFSLRVGPLFWPIAAYIAFVLFGWVNGILTGGDFTISLQEVRPQVYFLLAYLLAVNLVHQERQVDALLRIFVICVGLKGILYTFRRYVTLAGQPIPEQGVGSHEEAMLFGAFIMLLLILLFFGTRRKLLWVVLTLLPFVVIGNLATNRRAGTGVLILAIPILLVTAYQALPDRRKLIAIISTCIAVGFSIYYPAFRRSDSMWAQPARAIASQFEPNARDESSDAYRRAENQCLMATIRLAPLQGYGYGKRMLHAVPIADISKVYEWWDIMTHNQILWVWMRVGTFGFLAFWIMIVSIVLFACRSLRRASEGRLLGIVATFTLLVLSMVLLFGLLDLALSNYRLMLLAGVWTGALAALCTLPRQATPPSRGTA